MKLGKQVYRNKLNGELYRELISGNMPCGITLNKENIKKMLDWIKRTYKIASLDKSGV